MKESGTKYFSNPQVVFIFKIVELFKKCFEFFKICQFILKTFQAPSPNNLYFYQNLHLLETNFCSTNFDIEKFLMTRYKVNVNVNVSLNFKLFENSKLIPPPQNLLIFLQSLWILTVSEATNKNNYIVVKLKSANFYFFLSIIR